MVNFNAMLKQAQAMQNKLVEAQKKIEEHSIDGSAAGGMVKVCVSGKGALKSIKIDPSLLTPQDVEVLEDLIVAAYRDAKEKADSYSEHELSSLTGDMPLPGGFKLPF
jgi:DNA-binding YbaB/EbfC family protein